MSANALNALYTGAQINFGDLTQYLTMDVVICSLVSQLVLMRFPLRTCLFHPDGHEFVPNTSFI